jgi:hypothetical protein
MLSSFYACACSLTNMKCLMTRNTIKHKLEGRITKYKHDVRRRHSTALTGNALSLLVSCVITVAIREFQSARVLFSRVNMALLQTILVYIIACIVGFYVSVRLAIRYISNPSAFPVKKRDKPPKCLADPDLGIHGYLSLNVSTRISFLTKLF